MNCHNKDCKGTLQLKYTNTPDWDGVSARVPYWVCRTCGHEVSATELKQAMIKRNGLHSEPRKQYAT